MKRVKQISRFFVGAVVGLLAVSSLKASTYTLTPTDDAYICSALSSSYTYCEDDTYDDDELKVLYRQGQYKYASYLRFDLSSVCSSTITSATLRLDRLYLDGTIRVVVRRIRHLDGWDWDESSISAVYMQNYYNDHGSSIWENITILTSAGDPTNIDVTTAVQNACGGAQILTIELWADPNLSSPPDYDVYWYDRESPSSSQPQLIVTTSAPRSITVTSPSSGDIWYEGNIYTIRWTSTGSISNVKIQLYRGSSLVSTIASSTYNDGSYSWTVPTSLTPSTSYRIKISDASDPSVYDYSDYFTIDTVPTPASITVTEPTSSTVWYIGDSGMIRWTYSGDPGPYVDIKLYRGSTYITNIANNVPIYYGRYTWSSIPSSLSPGTNYRVKVVSDADASIYDYSPYFTIDTLPGSGCDTSVVINSQLTLYADCVASAGGGIYNLSGNVNINHLVYFTGSVVFDANVLSIRGNGNIFIPTTSVIGTLMVYTDSIDISISGALLDLIIGGEDSLSDFPVSIDEIEIDPSYVFLRGSIELADLGSFTIDTFRVHRTTGVVVAIQYAGHLPIHGFSLDTLYLHYNQDADVIGGGLTLAIPILTLSGGASLVHGQLDSIFIMITPSDPIPIGATGLLLASGGGGISNITSPPWTYTLCVGVTGGPRVGSEYIAELNGCFNARPMDYFSADPVNLDLIGVGTVASAYTSYDAGVLDLGFSFDVGSIVNGSVNASLNSSRMRGGFEGTIGIPDSLPWWLGWLSLVLEDNALSLEGNWRNNWISAMLSFELPDPIGEQSLAIGLEFLPDHIQLYLGTNFDNLTPIGYTLTSSTTTFIVPRGTPKIMVAFRDSSGTYPPYFKLISPSGDTLDTTSSYYLRVGNVGYYFVDAPEQGVWTVEIPFYMLKVPSVPQVAAFAERVPSVPTFAVLMDTVSSTFPINIVSPRDSLCVDIYLVPDEGTYRGAFVDSLCLRRGDNSVVLPPFQNGVFRVMLDVKDDSNHIYTPIISPFVVVYDNGHRPASPSILSISGVDSGIVVRWDTAGIDSVIGYQIAYRPLGKKEWEKFGVSSEVDSVFLRDIKPGRSYEIWVASYDLAGNISNITPSSLDTFRFVSSSRNNEPTFVSYPEKIVIVKGSTYSTYLSATDPDGDPITYVLSDAPPTMFITGGNNLVWVPGDTIVTHTPKLVALDGHGGSDTVQIIAMTIDTTYFKPTLSLDKGEYFSYDDRASVLLTLYFRNDTSRRETVAVRVRSTSDTVYRSINLMESDRKSGKFMGSIGFTWTIPHDNYIHVEDGDTIFVEYPAYNLVAMARFTDAPLSDEEGSEGIIRYTTGMAITKITHEYVEISFSTATSAHVSLKVYDPSGRLVATPLAGTYKAGYHIFQWNTRHMPKGIYLLRMKIGNHTFLRKIILR